MVNYYLIEIKGKEAKAFLRTLITKNINLYDIRYFKNKIIIKVSYDEYQKLRENRTTNKIKIIKVSGIKRIKYLIKEYKISLICLILGIFIIYFLSNIIFFINIDGNNKMKNIVLKELNKENITLFSYKKSFNKLKDISNKIKINNKDSIEWIELSYKGVILKVNVIEKINKKENKNNSICNIISTKNAYIRRINSSSGEVIKNIDDYVSKGDVIISGNIIRNEKVITQVEAKGDVYGEVWYKEVFDESIYKNKQINTKKGKKYIILRIFDRDITILKYNKNINKEVNKIIFDTSVVKLKTKTEYKKIYKKVKINDKDLLKNLIKKATIDMEKGLSEGEHIIMQKTLKSYIRNDRMYVEVFYKVYQNIGSTQKIEKIVLE